MCVHSDHNQGDMQNFRQLREDYLLLHHSNHPNLLWSLAIGQEKTFTAQLPTWVGSYHTRVTCTKISQFIGQHIDRLHQILSDEHDGTTE